MRSLEDDALRAQEMIAKVRAMQDIDIDGKGVYFFHHIVMHV